MKLKSNKKIATIITLLCMGLGGVFAYANGIDSNEVASESGKERAATTMPKTTLIYSIRRTGDGDMDYIRKTGESKNSYFTLKKVEKLNHDWAYCLDMSLKPPPYPYAGGPYGSLNHTVQTDELNKKILYAMEYNAGLSDYKREYYVRALGVHYANGEISYIDNANGGTSADGNATYNAAYNLASNIKNGSYRTTQDVSTSLSSISFSRNGNYFESNWISLNINQPPNLEYSARLIESTITLSGAPSGTQIIRNDGSVASGGYIGADTRFWIKVPVSSVGNQVTLTASAKSTFEVGSARWYKPLNSSYQRMAVRVLKDMTVYSAGSSSGTIVNAGHFEVTKIGPNEEVLANARFQLRSSDNGNTGEVTTNYEGKATFWDVRPGTYTLVETAAPSGYIKGGDQTVTVVGGQTRYATVRNQRQKGNFKVIKTDENGKLLSGARFQLKTGSTVHADGTTNSNGEVIFYDLPTGSYTLTEVSAPTGHVINSSQNNQTVSVSYNTTNSKTIKNNIIKGNIHVTKYDSADSNVKLQGAEFKLYNSSGTAIATAVTNSSGVAAFNSVAYGKYTVKETKAPTGYFLDSGSISFDITSHGTTYTGTKSNERKRDYKLPSYNVKDSSGNIVGTLKKNTNYTFNTKIKSEFMGMTLPSGATLVSPTVDLTYKIAVNDGTINQDKSSITTSNVKGAVLTSGTMNSVAVKDLSEVWKSVSFKTPNDETYGEIVIVVEIASSKEGDSSNNRLVVKLPIINERTDAVSIANMEVYPTASGSAIVGNDVNVKLDLTANSLKTYNPNTKIKIVGPSGFGTKTISKPAYGISLEESGCVYYKFTPTVAGSYTISAEASISDSAVTSSSKSITVVHPSEPKTYLSATNRTNASYSTSSYIETYVRVNKRDKDKIKVTTCSTPCQENQNGIKTCPGHKNWSWNSWYQAFIPRKSTRMTDIEESYTITELKFRSRITEENNNKYPLQISRDGYVDMLDSESAKYAQLKAGYGFDIKIKSRYENNLPQVFNKATTSNAVPGNTRWSEYETLSYSGTKMPFIYTDIYDGSKTTTVQEQISNYTGAISVTVPSLSDLIIESPDQMYIKFPDPSNEYYIVNEGYGTTYSASSGKIKQGLAMTNSTGIKMTSSKYYEEKVFEFKNNAANDKLDRRGYYVSKEVSNGVRTLSIFNRYAGYGINNSTRLHDRKNISIKINGSRYDEVVEMN